MSFGGGGSSSGGTQVVQNEPYAPAQPALNQIISDASAIYGQGPQYVAPTQQQLQGLAAQENIANLANTEIANTISGQYSNPFLSPLIADVASSAYTNVAQQFSGAGRTPGSPMSQQQVTSQLGRQALPLAFQAYNAERNRQLQTARANLASASGATHIPSNKTSTCFRNSFKQEDAHDNNKSSGNQTK